MWALPDFAAAAMWIPPGAEPDADEIVRVLTDCVPPEKHADTFAVLEKMDRAHPTYAHWYLPCWASTLPGEGGG